MNGLTFKHDSILGRIFQDLQGIFIDSHWNFVSNFKVNRKKMTFQRVRYSCSTSQLHCPFWNWLQYVSLGGIMKYLHEKKLKIIFLFWFQAPTKYGIKVSWPNTLNIFIFMPVNKILHPLPHPTPSVLYFMTTRDSEFRFWHRKMSCPTIPSRF